VDLRLCCCDDFAKVVDPAAFQILHRWTGSAVRHMCNVDVDTVIEEHKALQKRMQLFDQIEQRFAWQARVSTAIVGLTGFYMLYRFCRTDGSTTKSITLKSNQTAIIASIHQ